MTRRAFVSTYSVPQVHRDSGSKRLFDLMRFMRERGWDVTFVAATGIHDEIDARRLRRLGVTVYDAELIDVGSLAATARFDIALFAFWQIAEHMAPLFRAHSPDTRIVVDSVDAQFLRDARRAFRVGPSGGPAALLGVDYGDEIVGELNVYAAADCVLTVSQAEAELIGSLANDRTLTHRVPDSERPEAASVGFEARSGMLFVGSFQHPPNADAVRYACEEILPLIPEELRRQHPLYVVGDSLGETVRALRGRTRPRPSGGLGSRAHAVLRASARRARAASLRSRNEAQGDSGAHGESAHGRELDRRRGAASRARAGFPARRRRCIFRRGDRASAQRSRPVGAACTRRHGRDRAAQRGGCRRSALHRTRRCTCA